MPGTTLPSMRLAFCDIAYPFRPWSPVAIYLPMATTEKDIAHWTARVAELEAELDAATKLSEIKLIAAEIRRTRAALEKAKTGRAGPRPRREKSARSARRSASNEAEPARS